MSEFHEQGFYNKSRGLTFTQCSRCNNWYHSQCKQIPTKFQDTDIFVAETADLKTNKFHYWPTYLITKNNISETIFLKKNVQ